MMTSTKAKSAGLTAPEAVQETASPADEAELLGRQGAPEGRDEGEMELREAEFIEYAVTAKAGLRLRQEPSRDAPVTAVLPCGVGVEGDDRPAENGWRQVFTGRLFGWVMDEFLEPLELGADCGDG